MRSRAGKRAWNFEKNARKGRFLREREKTG